MTTIQKTPVKKSRIRATAGKTPAKKSAAKGLDELMQDSLKDIYWAEKALVKVLPKMQKNATNDTLKSAMEKHLKETEGQVKRLEDCFKSLGIKPQAKKCDAMAGLIEEGNGIIKETKPGAVRDAGIIAAAQKVEHYEIATYGTLAAFAKVLKEEKCLDNFLKTLEEERKCDETLTEIADTTLNTDAMN